MKTYHFWLSTDHIYL